MKKVNCDIWKTDFSEKGVEISVCNLIPHRLDIKFSKIIPFEEHIDFINNELAFLKSENYQRTTQNPLIETTHHKNGSVCFDFKDTEKDILFRVNPVKKEVWLEMFEAEYSKIMSLFE